MANKLWQGSDDYKSLLEVHLLAASDIAIANNRN